MPVLAGEGGAPPVAYLPPRPPDPIPGAYAGLVNPDPTIQDTTPWGPATLGSPGAEAAAAAVVAYADMPITAPAVVVASSPAPAAPAGSIAAGAPPSSAFVPLGAPSPPAFGPAQPPLVFNLSLAGGGRPAAGEGVPAFFASSSHGGLGGIARVLEHLGLVGHRRLPRHLENATRTPLAP